MREFTFLLINEKAVSYKKSILAIVGLNLIFFITLAVISKEYNYRNSSIFVIAFTLISFLIEYLLKKENKVFSALLTTTVLMIYVYLRLHFWWAAIGLSLVIILYTFAIQKPLVKVNKEGISYPSFPKKFIAWNELNAIVLKDGLLTLDFRNNRLIQQNIADGYNSINEKEFNDFCTEQLKK
jgi:hypothetical protein